MGNRGCFIYNRSEFRIRIRIMVRINNEVSHTNEYLNLKGDKQIHLDEVS